MANYSLVINSKFNPFTFDEMIRPYQMYDKAYREAEDKYTSLAEKAATLESMLNKDLDSNAYNLYQEYLNEIESESDRLSKHGLDADLKNSIKKSSVDYIKRILPLQQAAERRAAMVTKQQESGPDNFYEYDASVTPLDKYINDPVFTPKRVNLKSIRERSAAEFGQLAKQISNVAENPNYYSNDFDSTIVAKYGFSEERFKRVAEAVRSGKFSAADAAAEIIFDSIYNSTGVENWDNNKDEASEAVKNAITEGIVGAIGENKYQIVTDKKDLYDYKYKQELDNWIKMHPDKYGDNNGADTDNYDESSIMNIFPQELVANKEQQKLKQKLDNYINALNYFKANPQSFKTVNDRYNDGQIYAIDEGYMSGPFKKTYKDYIDNFNPKDPGMKHYKNMLEFQNAIGKKLKNVEFNYNVTVDDNGTPTFNINTDLEKMSDDLASMEAPVFYNVTEEAMKNMTNDVRNIVLTQIDNKNCYKYITTVNNKRIKRTHTDFSQFDWGNSVLFVNGGNDYILFAKENKVYKLKPGATGGSLDGFHKLMHKYLDNGDVSDYTGTLYNYMMNVYDKSNSKLKGQTGSTKTINDVVSFDKLQNIFNDAIDSDDYDEDDYEDEYDE